MTAEARLGAALAESVRQRLRGGGFVRLPELVSPLPIDEVLEGLADSESLLVAVFCDPQPSEWPANLQVTSLVEEAIEWRNDPEVTDDLVVIGDLERARASGLGSVPPIRATD